MEIIRTMHDDDPTMENGATETLSPVASRKQHFETIFQKPAPSLTSPSVFKRYEPGSLVKKRHSWIKDEIIDQNRTKPIAKQAYKSPLLRRLLTHSGETQEFEGRDEKNDDKLSEASREECNDKEGVDQSPMKDSAAAVASQWTHKKYMKDGDELQESRGETALVQGAGDKSLNASHNLTSAATLQSTCIEGVEITVSSSSSKDMMDAILNVSDLETDDRGENVAFAGFRPKFGRQMEQEKLKVAQRRRTALEQQNQEDHVSDTTTSKPAMVSALQKPMLANTPSVSNEYDELHLARVDSQSCETHCFDAMPCNIL
ncbi:hypothetical protein MPSEU_000814800 [Mayamaea pseudoterrestris]|nr:hypothetical protein MPSEU_000814800 [Mayamaea pseudoterrestris]